MIFYFFKKIYLDKMSYLIYKNGADKIISIKNLRFLQIFFELMNFDKN